jgi:hypothetical protein
LQLGYGQYADGKNSHRNENFDQGEPLVVVNKATSMLITLHANTL